MSYPLRGWGTRWEMTRDRSRTLQARQNPHRSSASAMSGARRVNAGLEGGFGPAAWPAGANASQRGQCTTVAFAHGGLEAG